MLEKKTPAAARCPSRGNVFIEKQATLEKQEAALHSAVHTVTEAVRGVTHGAQRGFSCHRSPGNLHTKSNHPPPRPHFNVVFTCTITNVSIHPTMYLNFWMLVKVN